MPSTMGMDRPRLTFKESEGNLNGPSAWKSLTPRMCWSCLPVSFYINPKSCVQMWINMKMVTNRKIYCTLVCKYSSPEPFHVQNKLHKLWTEIQTPATRWEVKNESQLQFTLRMEKMQLEQGWLYCWKKYNTKVIMSEKWTAHYSLSRLMWKMSLSIHLY